MRLFLRRRLLDDHGLQRPPSGKLLRGERGLPALGDVMFDRAPRSDIAGRVRKSPQQHPCPTMCAANQAGSHGPRDPDQKAPSYALHLGFTKAVTGLSPRPVSVVKGVSVPRFPTFPQCSCSTSPSTMLRALSLSKGRPDSRPVGQKHRRYNHAQRQGAAPPATHHLQRTAMEWFNRGAREQGTHQGARK